MSKSDFIGRWNVDSNFILETRRKLPKAKEENKGKFVVTNIAGRFNKVNYEKSQVILCDGEKWVLVDILDYTEEMVKQVMIQQDLARMACRMDRGITATKGKPQH